MIFRAKGIPVSIRSYVVGKITRDTALLGDNLILIVAKDDFPNDDARYLAILTCEPTLLSIERGASYIYGILSLDHLGEGELCRSTKMGPLKPCIEPIPSIIPFLQPSAAIAIA